MAANGNGNSDPAVKAEKLIEKQRKNCRESMKMLKEEYVGGFTGKDPAAILEYFTTMDDITERWERNGISEVDYIRIGYQISQKGRL